MTHKQEAFQSTANTIIKNLQKRSIQGFFFEDSRSCVEHILQMLPEGSTISWGGSETLKETGMMEALKQGKFTLVDRLLASSPEESRQLYAKSILSDYYFMSTNAITLNGELVNIDGHSNRVGCLVHGPSHVFIIAGMNKVAMDAESGIKRIRHIAAPANAKRLNKQTPCRLTGCCQDCFSPECMCNNIVITRKSGNPDRIKVFLVAEELGY